MLVSLRVIFSGLMSTLLIFANLSPPARGQCIPLELSKLIASDTDVADLLGYSVALSGDTAVVGAFADDNAGGVNAGSVYVFVRVAGVWTLQAKLTASDAAAGDFFGSSVAVSGDTAVIGAENDTHAGGTNAGSAYVFVRSGGVWTQQARLTASDAVAFEHFGGAVAVSGDTVLVGAFFGHAGAIESGSAYVFVRSGATWTEQAKLTASDAAFGDQFGHAVSLSGETALIGALADTHAGGINAGSAYAFVRSGAAWTEQTKLTASDPADQYYFGYSVAIDGDTALISSYRFDNTASAYVFVRSAGVWNQQAQLAASDAPRGFGVSVALACNTAVVGAHQDDHSALDQPGSAYVFVGFGGLWTQEAKLISSDTAAFDEFGFDVAVSCDTALVGAYFDDHAFSNAGSAYLFDLNCACEPCDVNCDGSVNSQDIQPFLDALSPSPPPCCSHCAGDADENGTINPFDVNAFLDCQPP